MREEGSAEEWRRLAAAKSIVEVIAEDEYVQDLIPLDGDDLPEWLRRPDVPAGWFLVRLEDSGIIGPARIAVCGQRADGRWDGSETLSAFRLTGIPLFRDVLSNAACTLRDLDADDVTTRVLKVPPKPGVLAFRSSGTFASAGRRVWARHSTYLAGSEQSAAGLLVTHNVFVESGCRIPLADDIAQLSDAVHHGFVAELQRAL